MPIRIIPTKAHAVLDLVGSATLFTVPRILGWDSKVTNLLSVVGAGALVYSMLTRYELGLIGLIPMEGHLALDGTSGAALCGAALMLRDQEEAAVIGALYGFGVFEIAAALMTQTQPTSTSIRQTVSQ